MPDTINVDTKLKELIAEYPWLKDELPKINVKFKMINSPMAKVLIAKITVGEMSKRSGMDEKVLAEKIQELINGRT